VRQSHCVACNWAKHRVFYFWDAVRRNSWLLSIADTKQSTGVFAHHYNCTFSFMMWHLSWACVYYNVWNNDISSRWDSNDWTTEDVSLWTSCELEDDSSWEWMGGLLARTTPLAQSAWFHGSCFCLQFQSLLVFGLLGTGYCSDIDDLDCI